MSTSLINVDQFTKILFKELNADMTAAAEPILKKALAEIEKKMREELAQKLISFIQNDFAVERMGHDIRILVKQAAK